MLIKLDAISIEDFFSGFDYRKTGSFWAHRAYNMKPFKGILAKGHHSVLVHIQGTQTGPLKDIVLMNRRNVILAHPGLDP